MSHFDGSADRQSFPAPLDIDQALQLSNFASSEGPQLFSAPLGIDQVLEMVDLDPDVEPQSLPEGFDPGQAMELLWENSLIHRSQTGGEIMVPFNVVQLIGEDKMSILHNRLRVLTGGEVDRFDDYQFGCVRLMPKSQTPVVQVQEWARIHISKQLHEAASQGMNLYPDLQKIPRPPNSFMLYRKHHHKPITAENPGVPNTAISRIIADMWKCEIPAVKDEFKMLAQMAKQEHAAKYPGYQYAPRKPNQRPRRRPRIHPGAVSWLWKTEKGAAIMKKATDRHKSDGWVPVNREFVEELDAQHMLLGPQGLGPPPFGATQAQFQELEEDDQQLSAADEEDFEPLFESLDEDFLEEILNFDDV
ncbi:hypothetical protein N7533_000606 [Penicillium manginii]|uniref:uncharacterized protein n=1 Tax=Penicillium manginii TaxID=203109 RepID=UPI00254721B0|nr:uncharacterized protein N7533_000606 [Penicillium manginii]KAJ5768023.1 hypothetical protein N7533_000606 [Penicillium manginii]